jgi:hypothetical protein
MADNEGFDTWDFRSWRDWRSWRPFQPYVLSPGTRILWWVMLPMWTGLIIAAFVSPPRQGANWLLYWVGFVGAAATITRDAVGRHLRRRRVAEHDAQGPPSTL